MFTRTSDACTGLLTVGAAAIMVLAGAPAASAAPDTSTFDQAVTAGQLIVQTTINEPLAAVISSHSTSVVPAELELLIDDATGSGKGWTVSQQISDFTYIGESSTQGPISAGNFSITEIEDAFNDTANTYDLAVDKAAPGTLDSTGRIIFTAEPEEGVGVYLSEIDVALQVPADSRAGTYRAILTTTITQGGASL